MNGFSYDIISILKHNVMYHYSTIGLILNGEECEDTKELLNHLSTFGYMAEDNLDKLTRYDYIVINRTNLTIRKFLSCLTSLDRGGIIILDVTGSDSKYEDKYLNMIGGTMSATKLRYEDRSYIVIHTGEDYGD